LAVDYYYTKDFKLMKKQIKQLTQGRTKNPAAALDYSDSFIAWQSEFQDGDKWAFMEKALI